MIFSETWYSLFWIVCNCFDDFHTNRPTNIGRFHRKQNTKFPKRRWVRSKNVFSSSALLFSLVVTKEYVLRTSSGLSTWNDTCFSFECRVTFRLGQFPKARFGALALYILPLRCLVISNTYKNSFCSLSKKETFQNGNEYVPKMSVWALLCFSLWLLLKNVFWSLSTWNNTCSLQMQSYVLAALLFERYVRYFGSLHPAFEMSCDTEYLEKNSFWFFRKRGIRCFGLCAIVSMIFIQTVRQILADFTETKTQTFQNDVEYVPKMSFWTLVGLLLWL